MQWVADVLVATITLVTELIASSWLSLLLLAFAVPFARKRALPETKLRPAVAYCIVALFALAVAAARTIIAGEPRPPWYTDDFGNVLSADTFAHGRLSNPTHPLHRYFETLYVLQTPRYMSVYPPGQGLLLAAAQRLLGLRVAGLWIASAVASCAVAWAVAAVATIELACAAGLLCAIHPTMMEWGRYYHAGALAAAAGALAVGGALRLASRGRVTAAMAMGAGMAILANTRPYEGLIVAVIACALAVRSPRHLALALAVTLAGLGFTAYYNRAVTGDPFLLPYNAYNARYLSAPNFIWQEPLPLKAYPTLEMATRYSIFRKYYQRSRHLSDFLMGSWMRLQEMLSAALPSSPHPSWLNALRLYAAIPLLFAWRRNQRIVAACTVFALAILQITWWPQSHYFAPAAVLFAVLYATGVWRMIDRGDGVLAYSCIAAAFAIAAGVYWVSLAERARPDQPRIMVTRALDARPGGQLVVADPICFDVVHNAADIDAAKIVWAHSAPDGVAPLLSYYRDREVWHLACEGEYRLEALRPAMVKGRADYEPDIFYPYHFPGR